MKKLYSSIVGVLIVCSNNSICSSSDQCIAYQAMLQGHICSSPEELKTQYYKCLRQDPQSAHYFSWRFCNCPRD